MTANEVPFFIVGCPRSGTTLLRDLLRSHPHLSIPWESHFIPQFYRGYGDPRSAADAVRLASMILRSFWVEAWDLELEPGSFADCRSYAQVVTRIFAAWAAREGRRRWGDKTPHNVAHIPTLRQIFPESQIIHIHRDGRDVVRSLLAAGFGPRNLYTAAASWKGFVRAGRTAGAALPASAYLEVCYEALVERPRETLERVCTFLGEPFTENVLTPTPMRWGRNVAPFRSGRGRPFRSQVVATSVGGWRTALSRDQRALFESVAGDLLEELGYETERLARPIPAVRRAWYRVHDAAGFSGARLVRAYRVRWLRSGGRLAWAGLRSAWRGHAP